MSPRATTVAQTWAPGRTHLRAQTRPTGLSSPRVPGDKPGVETSRPRHLPPSLDRRQHVAQVLVEARIGLWQLELVVAAGAHELRAVRAAGVGRRGRVAGRAQELEELVVARLERGETAAERRLAH